MSPIRAAQEQIRRSEALLAEAQRLAHLGSWEWEIATGRITWTDELYRICGLEPGSGITFDRFVGLIHPDDRAVARNEIDRALNTKSEFDFVLRIVWPDGTVRIMRDHGRVVLDDAGNIDRMIGTGQDITDAHNAQIALRESEERYRGLVELAPDAIIVRCADRLVYVNPAAARLFGAASAEALVGMSIMELVHDEVRDIADGRRIVEQEPGTKLPFVEGRLLRLDGTAFEAEVTSITSTFRGMPAVQSVIRDVTARRHADAELRRQALVFEMIGDAVMIIEPATTTIIDWNTAAERMFGYNKAEMLGQPPLTFHHPEVGTRLHGEIGAALAAHGRWAGEVRFRRKDGGEGYADVVVVSQYDASGRAIAHIGVNRDITERKRAEETLRRSDDRLQLSQRLEAVGQLAGGIAHDFNNLLTAISGYSNLLLDSIESGDEKRGDVLEIKKAATRAASLTRQLLAFSRKQVLQPRVIDLNVIVTDLEKMLGRLIGEHIFLVTDCAATMGRVLADPGQIEQVIVNLVVNARDAMSDGGTVMIRTGNVELDAEHWLEHPEVEASPGNYVMLTVSDTGTGMDRTTQAHVFEPFFTTKAPGKGTGLGLATVYGIVKQSGGYIWLKSEPGRGTTFTIYMPRVDAAGEEQMPSQADEASAQRGSETILLVEDEESVRILARRVLAQAGYTVLDARDGAEGAWLLERHTGPIDLLLTDVVMPNLSGRALAQRAWAVRPGLPVLYISGYTDGEVDPESLIGTGATYLEKPFTPSVLRDRVRAVLDEARRKSNA